MYPTDPIYTVNMNDQQRTWFYAEYERASKDEIVGLLLALLLGCFGAHHDYRRLAQMLQRTSHVQRAELAAEAPALRP